MRADPGLGAVMCPGGGVHPSYRVMLTSVTNTKPLLQAQPEGTPPAGH